MGSGFVREPPKNGLSCSPPHLLATIFMRCKLATVQEKVDRQTIYDIDLTDSTTWAKWWPKRITELYNFDN